MSLDGESTALLESYRAEGQSYSDALKFIARDRIPEQVDDSTKMLNCIASIYVSPGELDTVSLKLQEASAIIHRAIVNKRRV